MKSQERQDGRREEVDDDGSYDGIYGADLMEGFGGVTGQSEAGAYLFGRREHCAHPIDTHTVPDCPPTFTASRQEPLTRESG